MSFNEETRAISLFNLFNLPIKKRLKDVEKLSGGLHF